MAPVTAFSDRPFSHEALLHAGQDGFVAGAVPFIREGLQAGEPVMVAVPSPDATALRTALGADADTVTFADMLELGRNPGRIMPALREFVTAHRPLGRPVRGVGRPIWPGRTTAELVECQLHESLVNLAFADARGVRLLCPYDVETLDPAVIHEARCSHAVIVEQDRREPSRHVRDPEASLAHYDVPLPTPPSTPEVVAFDEGALRDVRERVLLRGVDAGLGPRADDLVLAVHEVAANSVRHGGGRGVLRIWREEDALVCEVRDRGHVEDPLAGRYAPDHGGLGGWGLYIAHQLCDLVQLRSSPQGTTVRLRMVTA